MQRVDRRAYSYIEVNGIVRYITRYITIWTHESWYNKGDNSDGYGKYLEINLLHDRSVNKIITGARNSIKRQSRYLSVAPVRCVILPCHNRRGLSRAHQKLGQEARLSPQWIQACIFFSPPLGFLSVELSAAEAIALPDEIFFHFALFLSLSLIPVGTDAKKYFAKTMETESFLRMPRYFFLKRERREGNSSVITLNVHCQLSREFER